MEEAVETEGIATGGLRFGPGPVFANVGFRAYGEYLHDFESCSPLQPGNQETSPQTVGSAPATADALGLEARILGSGCRV